MATRLTGKWIERLRRNRLSHRQRSRFVRSAAILAGCLLVVAGAVMLVTPGPAFVVLPLGLYLLALEFDWAERLLHRVLEHAEKAKDNSFARSVTGFVKRRPKTTAALLAIFLTLVAAFVISIFAPDVITSRI